MIACLELAISAIMSAAPIMALWVSLTSMLYLLHTRAHRFRPLGTLRLFATSVIIGVTIPLATWALGQVIDTQLGTGPARRVLVILSAPFLVILAFALTVTLIQRFMGADAETALALSWPITLVTYVLPLAGCLIYSIFKQPWLTGQDPTIGGY